MLVLIATVLGICLLFTLNTSGKSRLANTFDIETVLNNCLEATMI